MEATADTIPTEGLRLTRDLFVESPGEPLTTETYRGAVLKNARVVQTLVDIGSVRRREIMTDQGLNATGKGERMAKAVETAEGEYRKAVADSQVAQLEARCREGMDDLLHPEKALRIATERQTPDQYAREADSRSELRALDQTRRDNVVRAAARDGNVTTLRAALLVDPSFRLVSEEVERECLDIYAARAFSDTYVRYSEGLRTAYTMRSNARRLAEKLDAVYGTDRFSVVRSELGI